MGYYLRAFCTSSDLPALRTVFEWAMGHGVDLEAPSADLDADGWQQAQIVYKPDKQPFVAEADTEDLVREEVEEFVDLLEDVNDASEKKKVLDHLQQSKAVVATQLLNDVDDDGFTAAGTFLTYFVTHCGGLIQADGEGFYEGDRLIPEVE
jgi:hypothetical protein